MFESQITTDDKLPNIHPGEILKEEFLVPMNISAYRLAKEINIPQTRISEIIHGKRSITADTAIRFSKFFGTTAEFWLNLQNLYDLEEEEKKHAPEFETIKMYAYAQNHITCTSKPMPCQARHVSVLEDVVNKLMEDKPLVEDTPVRFGK